MFDRDELDSEGRVKKKVVIHEYGSGKLGVHGWVILAAALFLIIVFLTFIGVTPD